MADVVDTANFVKAIFTVKLGGGLDGADADGDLHRYIDILRHSSMTDHHAVGSTPSIGQPGAPALDPVMAKILSDGEIGDGWNASPEYFSRGKCRDTSLGGNDAVNCYPQFNETDDVSDHPFLKTDVNGSEMSGMGRVYSEVYDDQQQIMYITFGVPQYNSLENFYGSAVISDLASLMNDGISSKSIGRLIGESFAAYIILPAVPIIFIAYLLNQITDIGITKYYDFRSTMPLYYRCVNSIILHLSVNLGLNKDGYFTETSSLQSGNMIDNKTPLEHAKESVAGNDGTGRQGLPDIFEDYGFDIYRILCKKYKYINKGLELPKSSDDILFMGSTGSDAQQLTDLSSSNPNTLGKFAQDTIDAFQGQLYGASFYVGFRIEKGVNTSESFTNETGESSIAQQVNQKAQAARDAKFTVANGNIDGGVLSAVSDLLGGILSGAADLVGGESLKTVLSGNGIIDFPEIWKGSSFSKSYNFKMSLHSPYGDPYSIMQNLYIPLALLMSGFLPRGIGPASYTAPFVCRAYCRGMFAVPLGMINNITVRRGADQYGWTTSRLPTCLDIDFEIKDLSPAMFLAISDGGTTEAITEMFGSNSTFQEYLMTLSGMGLTDRLSLMRNLRRKAEYLLGQVRTSKLSPYYWGATLGNVLPARLLTILYPNTRLPNN
jgi:hypothetical protein